MAKYVVELEKGKVESLARIWGQDNPEELIEALFSWAYHHYVEEEDELVSGRLLRRKTGELESQLAELRKRVHQKSEQVSDNVLCPKCFSKVTYDKLSRDYACNKCGWEGPPEEVVRRQDYPNS